MNTEVSATIPKSGMVGAGKELSKYLYEMYLIYYDIYYYESIEW